MDFSNFRHSGELSDLSVLVCDKEFKLHEFPLFIKSDFFRALARSDSDRKVSLDAFPGGAVTFELVADFCYNIRIDVTRENVCELRCAAEFLQMNSRGNLVDKTDSVLVDLLTTAKLSRDYELLGDLLCKCNTLGEISEQAKIVDKCILGVVDCLLLSIKYGRNVYEPESFWQATPEARQKLFQMPLKWFLELFKSARDKAVRPAVLADLVQS